MKPWHIMTIGIAATLAQTALWHAFGVGDAFASRIEATARATLDHYEMPAIQARLRRGPLTRTLLLSGRADDFQHAELVRILSQIPGVGDVRWTNPAVTVEGAR